MRLASRRRRNSSGSLPPRPAVTVVIFLLLLAGLAGAIAIPAYAYIHNQTVNSYTIRHGLYRGASPTDGNIQVSTNQVTPGSPGSQVGSRLRIGLLHINNNFYEYVCTDTFACYHNHGGAHPECQYRPINGFRNGGVIMDRHSHPDADYCG